MMEDEQQNAQSVEVVGEFVSDVQYKAEGLEQQLESPKSAQFAKSVKIGGKESICNDNFTDYNDKEMQTCSPRDSISAQQQRKEYALKVEESRGAQEVRGEDGSKKKKTKKPRKTVQKSGF